MPITTGDKHKVEAQIKENGCGDFKWIAIILGVSPDKAASHQNFIEKA